MAWNVEAEKEEAEKFKLRAEISYFLPALAEKYQRLAEITEERAKLFSQVNHVHKRIEQARRAFLKRGHL